MMKRLNLALALSAILSSALWADDGTENNEGSAVFGRSTGAINTRTLDLG